MTDFDRRIAVRVNDEQKDALDDIIPEDVSRSDYLRSVFDDLIENHEEEIDDELLREARRDRLDRLNDRDTDARDENGGEE